MNERDFKWKSVSDLSLIWLLWRSNAALILRDYEIKLCSSFTMDFNAFLQQLRTSRGRTSIVVNSRRRRRQFSTTRNPDSLSHGQGTVSTSWLFRAGRQRARLQGTRRDKSSQIAAECFATSRESAPRYPREKPGIRNVASPRNLGCIIQKPPLRPYPRFPNAWPPLTLEILNVSRETYPVCSGATRLTSITDYPTLGTMIYLARTNGNNFLRRGITCYVDIETKQLFNFLSQKKVYNIDYFIRCLRYLDFNGF